MAPAFSLTMILGLAACGTSASQAKQPSTEENSVGSTDAPDTPNSNVLVAYFSATNTTKGVAEQIATSLAQLTGDAQWLPGERLSGSASQDTVMEWVNSLGLNLEEESK